MNVVLSIGNNFAEWFLTLIAIINFIHFSNPLFINQSALIFTIILILVMLIAFGLIFVFVLYFYNW